MNAGRPSGDFFLWRHESIPKADFCYYKVVVVMKEDSNKLVLEVGADIGSYRVLRKIGAGAMGAVYEVEHRFLRQRFALKLLTLHESEEDTREEAAELFLQEARITAQLSHPGIVSVQALEVEPQSGVPYFVMDHVAMSPRRRDELLKSAIVSGQKWFQRASEEVSPSGEDAVSLSLEDLYVYAREQKARIAPEIVRRILLDICAALQYAHTFGGGVLHRDIKPANILLRADGHAMIADFGVAKVMDRAFRKYLLGDRTQSLSLRMDSDGTAYHLIRGTREYMAPELFEGAPPTPQTDLYALGVSAYQLLTGEMLGNGALAPSDYGLAPEWDNVVQGCLRSDPSERWKDVATFQRELEVLPRRVRIRKSLKCLLIAFFCGMGCFLCGLLTLVILNNVWRSKQGVGALEFPREVPELYYLKWQTLKDGEWLMQVHPDFCGTLDLRHHAFAGVNPDAFSKCKHLDGVLYPSTVYEEIDPSAQQFEWEVCDGGARIKSVKKEAVFKASIRFPGVASAHETVYLATIPKKINGYDVVEIGNMGAGLLSGFKKNEWSSPREVLLPPSARLISAMAFMESKMEKIYLPEGLEVIGMLAFKESKLKWVEFPASLCKVETMAFAGTPLTSVKVPENAKIDFDLQVFENCTQLKDVPEELLKYKPTTVATFNGSPIPKEEKGSASKWEFEHGRVSYVRIVGGLSLRKVRQKRNFLTFVDLNDDQPEVLPGYAVPEKLNGYAVIAIGDGALEDYRWITGRVELSSTVKRIGARAFKACTLEAITLPEGLEEIGEEAFRASKLTQVKLPQSLKHLGASAFQDTKITAFRFPENVTHLGARTLAGCTFDYIDLNFPSALKAIPKEALWGASGIETVTFPEVLEVHQNALTGIGKGTREGRLKLYFKQQKVHFHKYAFGTKDENVGVVELHFPAGAQPQFDDYAIAFADQHVELHIAGAPPVRWCHDQQKWLPPTSDVWDFTTKGLENGTLAITRCNLTQSTHIRIPERLLERRKKVAVIASRAFALCKRAEGLEIPETVTTLEARAFEGMTSLKSVTLPNSIVLREGEESAVGQGIFRNCASLEAVTFLGEVAVFPDAIFSGCASLKQIRLPGATFPKRLAPKGDFEGVPDHCEVELMGSGERYRYERATNTFHRVVPPQPQPLPQHEEEAQVSDVDIEPSETAAH